ncbi:MAG: aromatic amino acid lyase, partial [Janthinobacterium lividum]
MTARETLVLHDAADLDRPVLLALAHGRVDLELGPDLLLGLERSRAALLAGLTSAGPVYGVTTGMGAMAGITLDAHARTRHQAQLVLGRAVGSPPWLSAVETRALLAVRLRTFLHPEAGVSPDLCRRLVQMLDADVLPCVPARGNGAAGEIIPLAHAGAVVLGGDQTLTGNSLPPFAFGAKEGVAFLEGVPGATALAMVRAEEAGVVLEQSACVLAAA